MPQIRVGMPQLKILYTKTKTPHRQINEYLKEKKTNELIEKENVFVVVRGGGGGGGIGWRPSSQRAQPSGNSLAVQ